MDIQGASAAAEATATESGRLGAFESVAAERREVEETGTVEREAVRSETREGVGERVDIEA